MEYNMKLPRNGKEFAFFLALLSAISVCIIAPIITCFEIGFSFNNWLNGFRAVPLIWVVAMVLALIVHGPAEKLGSLLIKKEDSFGAHMLANTVCTVLFMSMFMTVFGSWIGMGRVSTMVFQTYFMKWPRNFGFVLFVEFVIAQPIVRFIMVKLHNKLDSK